MSFLSHAHPRLLTFSLSLLAFAACNDKVIIEEQPTTVYNHTVVVYMMAENTLSPFLNEDFQEIVEGRNAIPSGTQILAYIDDTNAPRLYRITADTNTLLYTWKEDICSTDSASMCDVFDKVVSYSPKCEQYDLVISSHASGWIPQINRFKTRTVGVDNNSNSSYSNVGVEMEISTLNNVIQRKLGRVGYIFFDACYMQCIEVAHELRNAADYIVASPSEIPATGADFTHMMPCFFASDAPAQIVEQYYQDELAKNPAYSGVVISAVKTSETPALAVATQPIIQQLCADRTTPSTAGVQLYGPYCSNALYRPNYFDMLGLAMQTGDYAPLYTFQQQLSRTVVAYRATKAWYSVFSSMFDPTITDITRTCGVSMFLPDDIYAQQGWNDLYHDTEWYTDSGYNMTGW